MGGTRTTRDPIHGFVELDETEWAIVNSRPFQRLRDVRQLGMGHMVYPGANHTRFEHSIGCVHIATRMLSRLVEAETSRDRWLGIAGSEQKHRQLLRILRLGALLHDIGHAPFSHAGEDLFVPPDIDTSRLSDSDRAKTLKQYSHEYSTALIIRSSEISGIISGAGINPEEVVHVATEPERAKLSDRFARLDLDILNQVLTGELGADRCDYLLRDAHHSGQPAGEFDLERLIQQTTLVEHEGADYLGLLEGGAIVAEQMVANRYAAYINLYFHKAKRAYEQHLVRFLKGWLPGGRLSQDPGSFAQLSDSQVWAAVVSEANNHNGSDTELNAAARALAFREHFRVAFERVPSDLRSETPAKPLGYREFEKNVREKFGQDTFVDVCSHSATKLRQAQHRVMVRMKDRVRTLDTLSEIVKGMEDRIWRLRVHAKGTKLVEVGQYCANTWRTLVAETGGTS